MEEIHTFGLWIRQRRRALDLTQQELAERVGCSVVTIRKIEAEERRPSRQIAELLAESLEIPPKDRAFFIKFARSGYSGEPVNSAIPTAVVDADPPAAGQIETKPAGARRLAGLDEAPGKVSQKGGQALLHGLPLQHTPFIGREHELLEIVRLLEDPECRLLTLIGPAGIGKTRLALQTALEMAASQQQIFSDGVYFIPFAAAESPVSILPTLAGGIGFVFHGAGDPKTQLLNYLEKKETLLILDNFEHLLGAGFQATPGSLSPSNNGWGNELLVDILQSAPSVKLLVTSRERLNLRGEWLLDIHALPYPEEDQEGGFERFSSVALFLQTARRVLPGFSLRAEDKPWIARICQAVEGIPLGIEMAASWVRVLSCQEIAQEIERSLDFLSTSLRDVPERHRSMRAAFDYSWKLLSDEERYIFRKLSVFRGGFSREAAREVTGASLITLSALVDKSLLRHGEGGLYSFHELLKQYAAAKLDEDPAERDRALDKHCDLFSRLMEEHDNLLRSSRQPEVVPAIAAEIENIRAAWTWAVAHRRWTAISQAGRPLSYYYDLAGLIVEGGEVFDSAAKSLPAPSQALSQAASAEDGDKALQAVSRVAVNRAYFCFRLGKYREAEKILAEALQVLQAQESSLELADAFIFLGYVKEGLGEYPRAAELLAEGIDYSRRIGSAWNWTCGLTALGIVELRRGNYSEAEKRLEQSLASLRQGGDPRIMVWTLQVLSSVHTARGEYQNAQDLLRESLRIGYELKDRWGSATALASLGQVLNLLGKHRQAKYHLQDSLELFREIGDRWGLTGVLILLGDTECALSDCGDAGKYYRDALQSAMEIQALPVAMDALVRLASEGLKSGRGEQASEILTHVVSHPAARQEARDRANSMLAELGSGPSDPENAAPPPSPDRLETLIREILAGSSHSEMRL